MKREWDGHAGTAKRSMQATRSPLFTATDYILVVGESDFSFSLKLAQLVGGSNILASTLSSAEETNRIYPQAAINISSLGMLLGVFCFVLGSWFCLVHTC